MRPGSRRPGTPHAARRREAASPKATDRNPDRCFSGCLADRRRTRLAPCAPAAAGTGALWVSSVIFLSLGGPRGPFPQSTANFDGKESKRRFRKALHRPSGGSLHRSISLRRADKQKRSRGAMAPEFCERQRKFSASLAISRGSGAPKGANFIGSAQHRQTLPLADASGAERAADSVAVCASSAFGARSPSGAPLAALARTFTSWLSSRPGFLGLGSGGRYPPSPVPVQWKHPTPRP